MDAEAPKSGNHHVHQEATKGSGLMENAKTKAEEVQVKVVGATEGAVDATKNKLQPSGEPVVEGGAEKKKDHPCLPAEHTNKEDNNSAGGDGGGLMDKAKGLFAK